MKTREQKKEQEADNFAKENLLSTLVYNEFVKKVFPDFTKEKIVSFANGERVPASIVVGRLQYDGKVPYSMFNELKKKIEIPA